MFKLELLIILVGLTVFILQNKIRYHKTETSKKIVYWSIMFFCTFYHEYAIYTSGQCYCRSYECDSILRTIYWGHSECDPDHIIRSDQGNLFHYIYIDPATVWWKYPGTKDFGKFHWSVSILGNCCDSPRRRFVWFYRYVTGGSDVCSDLLYCRAAFE